MLRVQVAHADDLDVFVERIEEEVAGGDGSDSNSAGYVNRAELLKKISEENEGGFVSVNVTRTRME